MAESGSGSGTCIWSGESGTGEFSGEQHRAEKRLLRSVFWVAVLLRPGLELRPAKAREASTGLGLSPPVSHCRACWGTAGRCGRAPCSRNTGPGCAGAASVSLMRRSSSARRGATCWFRPTIARSSTAAMTASISGESWGADAAGGAGGAAGSMLQLAAVRTAFARFSGDAAFS